jgi:hypothetical protein
MNTKMFIGLLAVVVAAVAYLQYSSRTAVAPLAQSGAFSQAGYRLDEAASKRAIVLRAVEGDATITLPTNLTEQLHFFSRRPIVGEQLNNGLFPLNPVDAKQVILLTNDTTCPERVDETRAPCVSLNSIYTYDTSSQKLTLLATTTLSSAEGSELNVQATQGTKIILTVHRTGTGGICDNAWSYSEYQSFDLAHSEQGLQLYVMPAEQVAIGQAELEQCRKELQ